MAPRLPALLLFPSSMHAEGSIRKGPEGSPVLCLLLHGSSRFPLDPVSGQAVNGSANNASHDKAKRLLHIANGLMDRLVVEMDGMYTVGASGNG